MKTVTLPSGATAEIVEPGDLSFGDREDMFDLMEGDIEGLAENAGRAVNATTRAVMALAIKAWTCSDPKTGEPLPLPSIDQAVVRRLSIKDGGFLEHSMTGLLKELFPDFDVAPEPSPTQP